MGTYSNVTGAVNNYDCFTCDPGYYCSSVAGGQPTGCCWGGYYCDGGARNPRQHYAEPGLLSMAYLPVYHKILYLPLILTDAI